MSLKLRIFYSLVTNNSSLLCILICVSCCSRDVPVEPQVLHRCVTIISKSDQHSWIFSNMRLKRSQASHACCSLKTKNTWIKVRERKICVFWEWTWSARGIYGYFQTLPPGPPPLFHSKLSMMLQIGNSKGIPLFDLNLSVESKQNTQGNASTSLWEHIPIAQPNVNELWQCSSFFFNYIEKY